MKYKVDCDCGLVSGEASLFMSKDQRPLLGWQLTGKFYVHKQDLLCVGCNKPILIKG